MKKGILSLLKKAGPFECLEKQVSKTQQRAQNV